MQARGLCHHGGNHLYWENREVTEGPQLGAISQGFPDWYPMPTSQASSWSWGSLPCCYAVRYWVIHVLLYKSWSSHCSHQPIITLGKFTFTSWTLSPETMAIVFILPLLEMMRFKWPCLWWVIFCKAENCKAACKKKNLKKTHWVRRVLYRDNGQCRIHRGF